MIQTPLKFLAGALLLASGCPDETPTPTPHPGTPTSAETPTPTVAANTPSPCGPGCDADADGWSIEADCDDGNPAIHPRSPEICDNDRDENCNTLKDDCPTDLDVDLHRVSGALYGATWAAGVGREIRHDADLTGDGITDAAILAPGSALRSGVRPFAPNTVYIVSGTGLSGADLRPGIAATITLGDLQDVLASAIAVGDFNGDGAADLAVGVPGARAGSVEGAGAVYVFSGPFAGARSQADAQSVYRGTLPSEGVGIDLFAIPSDAGHDLYVGARRTCAPGASCAPDTAPAAGERVGAVVRLATALPGDHPLFGAPAGARFGNWERPTLPSHLGHVGDIDGDGRGELVVSATDSAQLWILRGGFTGVGTIEAEGTSILLPTEEAGEIGDVGRGLASGDLNGDGHRDLVIGNPTRWGEGAPEVGAVYIAYGPLAEGKTVLSWSLSDVYAESWLGSAVAVGDFNGDGADDLAAGIPGRDAFLGGLEGGVVDLYLGPLTEPLIVADVRLSGMYTGDHIGLALAGSPEGGLWIGSEVLSATDQLGGAGGAFYLSRENVKEALRLANPQ